MKKVDQSSCHSFTWTRKRKLVSQLVSQKRCPSPGTQQVLQQANKAGKMGALQIPSSSKSGQIKRKGGTKNS